MPSLTCKVGRTTAAKSIWPQGCGMYQAVVRSGAGDLNGLTTPARAQVAAPAPATVQVVKVGFCDVASDARTPPLATTPSVSGASADTDQAPGNPHGARGVVQRISGMRVTRESPARPPKLS